MKAHYYSLKEIEKKHAIYNVIIGERSNGKTYSICEKTVRSYFKDGSRMALIRRFKEDLTPRNIGELLTPHVELIKRLFEKDWKAVAIILGAGITGALVGLLVAINPLIGAVIGFAASGYITIAQNIGHDAII